MFKDNNAFEMLERDGVETRRECQASERII